MRADRLLTIVLLLQKQQHMKAKDLAQRLGVSERTIYRDIDALSLVGIPVYTQTGPDGGCFLDEGYRSSLNWLTGTELQTLLYTASASPLSDLGINQAMDSATLKLLAMLPQHHQNQVQQMQQRLYLDPSGWYGNSDDHPMLPTLKQAVWDDTVIDVQYENWEGQQRQYKLAPYSLVYKLERWYLVAAKYPEGAFRTFRVVRLRDIQLAETSFERDLDFNIVEYWEQASQQFQQQIPIYPVTLRAHRRTQNYFQHMFYGRYTILDTSGDWWLLEVIYTVFEEARTSILGLGTDVEVIEPQALHDAVVEQAQAIVKKYQP